MKDGAIAITPREESDRARAMWGMQRTLVNNLVLGVTQGFSERLEISGVGYRAAVQGKNLQLAGRASATTCNYPIPAGIQIVCEKPTIDLDHRHRQAAGRAGGSRNPQLSSAGALQGQGRAIRERADSPQRRQEEIGPSDHGEPAETVRTRAKRRTRYRIAQTSGGRPRLSVYRSGKHIYAQLIDDWQSRTIAARAPAKRQGDGKKKSYNVAAAAAVGKLIASRAIEKGVKKVVFDRGGYLYHGRVKALAEAAREGGLEF